MSRHERRKAAVLKRREQRANLKRALSEPWSAAAVVKEYQRRLAMGLSDINADLFPADVRMQAAGTTDATRLAGYMLSPVPPQASDATE